MSAWIRRLMALMALGFGAMTFTACEPHFIPSEDWCNANLWYVEPAIPTAHTRAWKDYDIGTNPLVNCLAWDTGYGYFCFTSPWSTGGRFNYLLGYNECTPL